MEKNKKKKGLSNKAKVDLAKSALWGGGALAVSAAAAAMDEMPRRNELKAGIRRGKAYKAKEWAEKHDNFVGSRRMEKRKAALKKIRIKRLKNEYKNEYKYRSDKSLESIQRRAAKRTSDNKTEYREQRLRQMRRNNRIAERDQRKRRGIMSPSYGIGAGMGPGRKPKK